MTGRHTSARWLRRSEGSVLSRRRDSNPPSAPSHVARPRWRAGRGAQGSMIPRSRPRTPELNDRGSIGSPGWHAHEDEASFRHVAAIVVHLVQRPALIAPRVGANHEAIGTGAGQGRRDELDRICPPKALAKELID